MTASPSGLFSGFVATTIADLVSELPPTTVIGIDMPIGLPADDSRRAEREARTLIGPRRASVFSVPLRAALHATTLSQASAWQSRVHRRAKRLSIQSFSILPKIREIDALVSRKPDLLNRLIEVHPEVSFCCWNDHTPLLHPKKSLLGRRFRAALIEAVWPDVASRLSENLRVNSPGQWALDDLYDAFAALWSAERYSRGAHHTLPTAPEHDATGLPMRIIV